MNKENIKSLNEKIADNEQAKISLEQKIKVNQQLLQDLHKEFEKNLNNLKELQDIEDKLRKEISSQHKEDIKKILNFKSVKETLQKASPLFSKIKDSTADTVRNVKIYIESNTDKQWIENKYNEYKEIALKKGEDIKSREEFQKIALSLKNVQSEIQELNLYDIMHKLSVDVGDASLAVKKVIKKIKIEEKIDSVIKKKDSLKDYESGNKLIFFKEWVSHKQIDLNDTPENLYDNYFEYLTKKYSDMDISKISYTKRSGSFTKALNKFKQI